MTKRILAALLALLMLVSLASCAAEDTPATEPSQAKTEEKKTEEKKTEEKKTEEKGEVKYDKVDTPLTPERIAAIPVARQGMTSSELRQICVDYVKLSVSFQWVPNMDFEYYANQSPDPQKFYEGNLHGGIPYINTASNNVYRVMEFYDPETGIWDVEYLSKDIKIFGTACSGTTGWGWARVINSARTGWTASLNASHGLIPVGSYTYDLSTVTYGEDGKEDCKDICHRNGKKVMTESYALCLPGDCLVNNGHVIMAAKNPVVVRKEDGSIDLEKSHLVIVEQGLFTKGEYHKRVSADGTPYVIQGNEGKNPDGSDYFFTFEKLYDSGYLPHTFKEFLGTDPIEPAEATIGITDPTITIAQLDAAKFEANYVVSDVFTTLTDHEGKQLVRYAYRSRNHFTRSFTLKEIIPRGYLWSQKDKGYHLTITAQLGNGEIVTAYEGTLQG